MCLYDLWTQGVKQGANFLPDMFKGSSSLCLMSVLRNIFFSVINARRLIFWQIKETPFWVVNVFRILINLTEYEIKHQKYVH